MWRVMVAVISVLAWSSSLAAVAAQRVAWLTGAELDEQLAVSVEAAWSGTPLRDGLTRFSQTHRMALVIDRRVDPGRPLAMVLPQHPLRETCHAVAAQLGLGFTLIGPVGYLGPTTVTEPLRTLVAIKSAEVQKLPPEMRSRLSRVQDFRWDDLATPRELVEQLAREGGLRIEGLNLLPHDLWAAADLPAISWTERLSLVLAQYDLSYRVDATARTLTLEPMPDEVQIERRYAIVARPQDIVEQWKKLAPKAKIELADGRITVVGRLEDHELVNPVKKAPPVPPKPGMQQVVGPGKQVHTLKVENKPLGPIIDALASRLNLTLRFDRAAAEKAGIKLDQLVSLSVKEASTDDLFRDLLTPVGLKFKLNGTVLEISPK